MAKVRAIRIRWNADSPPLPLGCRWCGHAPYAHEARSLPHRRDHLWEQPTSQQVCARMAARRLLGLGGRLPVTAPSRPLKVHPPAAPSQVRPGRHARPVAVIDAYGGGRSPDTTSPPWRREPYRRGVAA
ncbi:hypothetical protein OG884_09185 [Streptosporangium sp. NBC_01755]|uniref:hypothetical protein n=1 Tax=unclassified Streptosporangium TaxID=2632669 RepID=UPI002DDB3EBB|nr:MULTISPECIES: hypothetical protein [unclassified Streptosporangium]WSA26512.1 hypothetical protein OIE13_00965 [Streptosporangium sp. NBC_01810]WSD02065.1 hypothetical protein OG884_09185 [Streptosporangium sp. NBC_01755]